MEAGGIEPPSRDSLENASTCVFDRLRFGRPDANRQASSFPIPTVVSLAPGQEAGTN